MTRGHGHPCRRGGRPHTGPGGLCEDESWGRGRWGGAGPASFRSQEGAASPGASPRCLYRGSAGRVLTSPPRPAGPQAQVSNLKRENEALRAGQGASLTVVKQNTDVALQNLRVVMHNAHASIR